MLQELLNFKIKVNIATGNDSYEAWRENIHDDLVLCVALACWFGEQYPPVLPVAPRENTRPSPWRGMGSGEHDWHRERDGGKLPKYR